MSHQTFLQKAFSSLFCSRWVLDVIVPPVTSKTTCSNDILTEALDGHTLQDEYHLATLRLLFAWGGDGSKLEASMLLFWELFFDAYVPSTFTYFSTEDFMIEST